MNPKKKRKAYAFAELVGSALRSIEADKQAKRSYSPGCSLSRLGQSSLDKLLNAAAGHVISSGVRGAQKFKNFSFDGVTCDLECAPDGDAHVVWILSQKSGSRLIGLYQRNVSTF